MAERHARKAYMLIVPTPSQQNMANTTAQTRLLSFLPRLMKLLSLLRTGLRHLVSLTRQCWHRRARAGFILQPQFPSLRRLCRLSTTVIHIFGLEQHTLGLISTICRQICQHTLTSSSQPSQWPTCQIILVSRKGMVEIKRSERPPPLHEASQA